MKRRIMACAPATTLLATLLLSGLAAAQEVPPGTGTDMEIDSESLAPPPQEDPEKKEEPVLPPVDPNAWGVGGEEAEAKFGPEAQRKKDQEEADNGPPRVYGPPGEFSVDMVIGFGDIRVVDDDSGATGISVLSFLFDARYRFGEVWGVGLRLPFSTGSVTAPPGGRGDYNTFALGNLEIAVRPTIPLTNRLSLPITMSFFAPMASGDLFAAASDQGNRAQSIVNQAASASRGWEVTPLFASKRAGFSPGVGVVYDRGAAHLGASTKLDIMIKTGGNDPTSTQGTLQDPNTTWVTTGSFFYDFLDGMVSPGLKMWLAVATVPVRVGVSREYSGPQFVLEPDVTAKIPLNEAKDLQVAANLGVILPVGGHLGGSNDASVMGVRIGAGLLF